MNLEVDSKDEVMHIYMKMNGLWFSRRRWLAVEKEWQQVRSGYCEGVEESKFVKIAKLSGCKNFVGKRQNFIFDAFVDL